MQVFYTSLLVVLSLYVVTVTSKLFRTTGDRIATHDYPWESHTAQTEDGYILTMFRIPYSKRLANQMDNNKSVVLLLHGLTCSSDFWVLNGPDDGLVYMLSDAGYDVWIGNARCTDYSQQHISKSPLLPSFWEFSWHEIGYYDIPAMIDYILPTTGQSAIHYVGHSQGATTFMVMLSSRPNYNNKIKTSHLLAPPVFMEHMSSPLIAFLSPLLEKPNVVANLIGKSQFTLGDELLRAIAPPFCKRSTIQDWCADILFLVAGGPSPYTNRSLLADFFATYPADSSTRQLLHYIQERDSGKFRRYDLGSLSNIVKYGTTQPPEYNLKNVNTQVPIDLYYSDNDDWVAVQDVERLANILGGKVSLHHIMYPEFNHMDYLIATNIKEVLNECIVDQMNEYENKPFFGNLCKLFKKRK